MKKDAGISFMILGVVALLTGMFFGCFGGLQYVFPELNQIFSFQKTRPLHVSLVVSWLYLASIGGIYHYLPSRCGLPLFSKKLANIHLWIFLVTGLLIVASYFMGIFGGREYWAFHPILAIPIVVSWVIFGINYIKTISQSPGKWPVYYWMWGTGIIFFLFSFVESYLWLLPFFRDSIVRDMTVQWKSYGEIVGSWNMLIYGTAIFLMDKMSQRFDESENRDEKPSMAFSKQSFLLYFLGLTNLMFGWAHHLYMVPSAGWIRHMGYAISMTELIILAKIIWEFRGSFINSSKRFHIMPFRFLMATDIWILINLILAILISIPAIQVYTHGTHITVAHAMGSTIGINSMILIASICYMVEKKKQISPNGWIGKGFWISNIFFLIFFSLLVIGGIMKGIATIEEQKTFQQTTTIINPVLEVFAYSGIGLFAGFCFILFPSLKQLLSFTDKDSV